MTLRKSIITTRLLRNAAKEDCKCDNARATSLQLVILKRVGEECSVECIRAYFRDRMYRASRAEGSQLVRHVKSAPDKAWLESLWVTYSGKCPHRNDRAVQAEVSRRRVTFQDVQQWFGQRRFKQSASQKHSTHENHRRAHIFGTTTSCAGSRRFASAPPAWSGGTGLRLVPRSSTPRADRAVRNILADILIAYNETTRLTGGGVATTVHERCCWSAEQSSRATTPQPATCAWRDAIRCGFAPALASSCTQSASCER